MDEVTQYIVVRSDIGMSKGKTAAQVAHAAVSAVLNVQDDGTVEDVDWLDEWNRGGHAKIVLKASAAEFEALRERLAAEGRPFSCITDEGRTQIATGTRTAIALRPMPRSIAAPFVEGLALL